MSVKHDFSKRNPYSLLQGRLGVYDRPIVNDVSNVQGVLHQQTRLQAMGGSQQQERMIRDKRRSLDRAVWNSYQAARIIKVGSTDLTPVRALINPNQLKQDYDDKILSVGFEYGIGCGDVFEWVGTNTYWIVYLQDLTELAYFKGDIRKCSYEIAWEDESGKHSTFVAIKGPSERTINAIQKHNIDLNIPNYSLSLLMPKTDETLAYFKRYSKFYLQGQETCWRVEAIDWLSTPGILEVNAMEYYANEIEDDVVNGIVGGLITEPINPNTPEQENLIIGETFIKPKRTYQFKFNGSLEAEWMVDKTLPVELVLCETDPKQVNIKWTSSYCGQFDLHYGDYHKTIVVESLF